MTTEIVSPELRTVLRKLKLSGILDTFPERLAVARQQKMGYQDLMLLVFSDEVSRRDSIGASLRAHKAHLDPHARIENWDDTAKVTFDRQLLNELISLRMIEAHNHVAIVGHVGVGKTFLAHAIGHAACRRGHSVIAVRADRMLKTLKQARLIGSYEAELRRLISTDLLIVDDFALDAMEAQESRDAYEIFVERHRAGSMIVTSNRGPDEWLATFADPPRPERHRPLHQQRLRPRHRRRELPHATQARKEGRMSTRNGAGTASKRPIDGAGAAGAADARTDARPQLLGRRPTAAGAHSALENRPTNAGFPHRQQAPHPEVHLPERPLMR